MNSSTLKKIIDQARQDPQFFHALVFNPEQALKNNRQLSEQDKKALLQMNPADLVSQVAEVTSNCNPTCTGSCDGTCSGRTCSYTCGRASCEDTCRKSCGRTSLHLEDSDVIV